MELFVVGVERVNIVVIVVFEAEPLIGFRGEVLSFCFDGLEFGDVLLVFEHFHEVFMILLDLGNYLLEYILIISYAIDNRVYQRIYKKKKGFQKKIKILIKECLVDICVN